MTLIALLLAAASILFIGLAKLRGFSLKLVYFIPGASVPLNQIALNILGGRFDPSSPLSVFPLLIVGILAIPFCIMALRRGYKI